MRRDEFGLHAQLIPPYLIKSTTSYPAEQIEQSRQLAAATDIFYNRGRAVGFFLPLCDLFNISPATLLQRFADWLLTEKAWAATQPVDIESWTPDRILPLQRDFCRAQCRQHRRDQLIPLIEDLLHFHYLCAEILLGDDCRPTVTPITVKAFANARWCLSPAVFLQFFHYDPADLEALEGMALATMARQLQPQPGERLLLRVAGEMIIEALDAKLARMLRLAATAQSGSTLLDQLDPQQAEETVVLAVEQGILLPVI